MRPYEIAIIFDTGVEETAVKAFLDRLLEAVRARGGSTGRIDRLGRRVLAYPIKHRTEGNYFVVGVSLPPEAVDEIDRQLSLSDAVLRHKVIRLPEVRRTVEAVVVPRAAAVSD
jgi:small subunit ribosomal protein S6